MKQTAIEWLQNELKSLGIYGSTLKEKCESAKEMEKQQIIDTYKQGQYDGSIIRETDAEQYYNKTFKQD